MDNISSRIKTIEGFINAREENIKRAKAWYESLNKSIPEMEAALEADKNYLEILKKEQDK